MKSRADAGGMELILIALLLLVGPLALLFGADSRVDEKRWADWRRF
jgi:hypothetical protein